MKQKSLAKNAIWNFLYSGLNLIFPLLTAPYVSRTLGAVSIGTVDFANSFVLWFVTFATFGTTTYGVRVISQARGNKKELNKVFSEIFSINLIFSIIALILYLVVILNNFFFTSELKLYLIVSLSIVLNAFNIDWFYQGIEEYSYITIRNGIIKIISLISIFLFVSSEEHYVVYALISVLATSLSGILNVVNSKKYVKLKFTVIDLHPHVKSLFTFYLITLVINVYLNLDRTLLGFLDTKISVAYLSRASLVANAASTMAVSVANVAMPRASYYLKNDIKKYEKLIKKVPELMMFLTIPTSFGIFYLSDDIMLLLGGEEFLPAGNLLKIIAFVTIFSSLSTFLQQQVIVPSNNEKFGLIGSIFAAISSLVSNLILIPIFSYLGAGIAQLISQFIAMYSRYYYLKKKGFTYIKIISLSTVKYLIAALFMFIPIYIIDFIIMNFIFSIIIKVLLGGFTYFTLLFFLQEENFLNLFERLNQFIKNRKTN